MNPRGTLCVFGTGERHESVGGQDDRNRGERCYNETNFSPDPPAHRRAERECFCLIIQADVPPRDRRSLHQGSVGREDPKIVPVMLGIGFEASTFAGRPPHLAITAFGPTRHHG